MKMSNVRTQILFFVFILITGFLNAQVKCTSKSLDMSVSGTSTMHDWEMKSSGGECNATLTLDSEGNLTGITVMNLKVSSKALKSGKGSMDKNAYKALKADNNPNITASLKSAEVSTKDNKTYTIKSMVKLTIAGKTLETELVSTAKKINDSSYQIKGEKKISMKDYDMSPPSFMLGAVKTGNDVVISYEVVLNQ